MRSDEPGSGNTFTVDLPRADRVGALTGGDVATAAPPLQRKLLVAGDNPDGTDGLVMLLGSGRAVVAPTSTGVGARGPKQRLDLGQINRLGHVHIQARVERAAPVLLLPRAGASVGRRN